MLLKRAFRTTSSQAQKKPSFQQQVFSRLKSSKDLLDDIKQTKRSILDENASRYGGMTSKSFRDAIRQSRVGSNTKKETAANDQATGVVMHKDSIWKERWNAMKDDNPVISRVMNMKRTFEESDSPLVNFTRNVTMKFQDMFGSIAEENEHAITIAEIKEQDPTFDQDEFVQDLREFVIPEVLEAYVKWDEPELKQWMTDGVVSVLKQSRDNITQDGSVIEGQLLDLRNVELQMAKIIDDVPLLIVTFKTQQVESVHGKDGELVAGSPDLVQDVYYAWALMKDRAMDETFNPLTRNWKIAEFSILGVRQSI